MAFFELSFWAIPFFFGSLQGIFLAIILFFHNDGKKKSNILLALLSILISMNLAYMALYISNQITVYPHTIWSTSTIWYVLGPLFYVYIKTRFNISLKWYDSLHFIPFLYKFSKIYKFYFFASEEIKLRVYERVSNLPLTHDAFFHYVISAIYIYFSYKLLKKLETGYKKTESNTVISTIEHHKKLSLILAGSITFIYLAIICSLYFDSYGMVLDYLGLSCLSILIYSVILTAIKEPTTIFLQINDIENKVSVEINSELINKIKTHMNSEQPYLQADLKLIDLANSLEFTIHQLSSILNNQFNQNFYDFINTYRVEEAKSRLIDPSQKGFTILAIAIDSGFNSKASFNRIFKNSTGLTPSGYIKQTQLKSA